MRHWYNQWKKSIDPGGKERVDRTTTRSRCFARSSGLGAALRFEECRLLESELAMVKFDKGDEREQAMTYPYALAFISKAKELAANGVIPEWRARSMAIGLAAQFELMLRQKHIIGQWDKPKPNKPNSIYLRGEM